MRGNPEILLHTLPGATTHPFLPSFLLPIFYFVLVFLPYLFFLFLLTYKHQLINSKFYYRWGFLYFLIHYLFTDGGSPLPFFFFYLFYFYTFINPILIHQYWILNLSP